MKALRAVLSAFLLAMLVLTFLGWRWAGNLPALKREGARTALVLAASAASVALGLIWTIKPRRGR